MKKLLCFFLFILPLSLQAERLNVDSLLLALDAKETTRERLEIYSTLYDAYMLYDIGKAELYIRAALELAEKEDDKLMSAKFNGVLGRVYEIKNIFDTALIYCHKGLELAIEVKDRYREANITGDIAIIYARQNENAQALEYFIKSISIDEEIGDTSGIVVHMTNIAILYSELENYERALYYLEKARILAEDTNYGLSKMQVYQLIGSVYLEKTKKEENGESAQSALEYLLKAHTLSRQSRSNPNTALIAHDLSILYADFLNDYDKAMEYAEESLLLARKLNDTQILSIALNSIAKAHLVNKRYKEADAAATEALETDSASINDARDAIEVIIEANLSLGNKEKSMLFFGKYRDIIKKLIEESERETMADMEVKYETEKKEMRIAALEKARQLYAGLGAASVLILLLGIALLSYRHRLIIQKHKLAEQHVRQLEQERELISARSALNAEKSEREIIARDLHDGVGAMLSVVKNNMNIMRSYSVIENEEVGHFNRALDVLDKSIVELRRVAHHIMPAALIDKGLATALNDFCRSIPEAEFHVTEPSERFAAEKELVLYRCAYELINNALRHAAASHIDVHLSMNDATVYLSVVDDGCGFDPQTAIKGMGINNMRTRLITFGGRIDYYSEPGKGTEANIEIDL